MNLFNGICLTPNFVTLVTKTKISFSSKIEGLFIHNKKIEK